MEIFSMGYWIQEKQELWAILSIFVGLFLLELMPKILNLIQKNKKAALESKKSALH